MIPETTVALLILIGISLSSFILGMLFYRTMHRRVKRRYNRIHGISIGQIL